MRMTIHRYTTHYMNYEQKQKQEYYFRNISTSNPASSSFAFLSPSSGSPSSGSLDGMLDLDGALVKRKFCDMTFFDLTKKLDKVY